MILQPSSQLFFPSGGVRVGEGRGVNIVQLLYDIFTTPASVPLANPTACEPGPGSWVPADPNNRISKSGGQLVIASSGVAGNAYLESVDTFTRVAGLGVAMDILQSGSNYLRPSFGDTVASILVGLSAFFVYDQAAFITPGGFTFSGMDRWAIVLRSTGAWFIGDVMGVPTLLWVGVANSSNQKARVMAHANTAAGVVDNVRIGNLPAPWTTDYGIATNRVATPGNNETTTMEADAIVEFTLVAQAGVTQSFSFRRTDDDNTLRLDCGQAGGTIKLYRRAGGVDTEMDAGKTQTWVAGNSYRIVVICSGTTIQTFVSNTIKHNTTTAVQQSATGVKVSHTGSNLIAWPRFLTGASATTLQLL